LSSSTSSSATATTAAMTAAGKVIVRETVVKMDVGLSISKDDFTKDKQEDFKQEFANIAGRPKKEVRIKSIESVFLRRRRLLAESIRVSVEVVVQNVSQGLSVSSLMTPENLNTGMSRVGLPALEVLQSARVEEQVVVAPSPTTTPAPLVSPITTAADTTVVLASTPIPANTSQDVVVVMDDAPGNTVDLTTLIAGSLGGAGLLVAVTISTVILYRRRAARIARSKLVLTPLDEIYVTNDRFQQPTPLQHAGNQVEVCL